MKYLSTRNADLSKSFTDVLLEGLASDGGLYIPEQWLRFKPEDFESFQGLPYAQLAQKITAPFIGDEIESATMEKIFHETYGQNFHHKAVAPLIQIDVNLWIMELFHGPTLAFKDYALQILGRLFDHVLAQKKQRVTIVGATSGDTGSAAIEACKGCENIDIFILHPEGRTSEVQRRQMTTVDAPNVHNIALQGTFDDCQNMVKAMFNDQTFRQDMNLSAVNSINWARILSQIVYYVSASLALGGVKRPVSFAVPTGNFGNVYAAYAAQSMGLPIEKLIIGSNRNDILTRFFETGTMEVGGVEPSLSPSMDIQISSNFERYLCDLLDRDTQALAQLMAQFKEEGSFSVPKEKLEQARKTFSAQRCTDGETLETMRQIYQETGYTLDPHTAVGVNAAQKSHTDNTTPIVALACAHPAKFPDAVEKAIGQRPALPPAMADLFDRPEIVTSLPNDLGGVQDFIRKSV